ncbi:MAG: CHAT domain-containing protein [Planctomycetes bacterium]|nr:CHAT domain-containing protein [Planctomycetota bacterium]
MRSGVAFLAFATILALDARADDVDPFIGLIQRMATPPRDDESWRDLERFAEANASRPGCRDLVSVLARERELLSEPASAEERRLAALRDKAPDPVDDVRPPLGLAGILFALRRGDGLARAGRFGEAEPLLRQASEAAETIGWPLARARGDRVRADCLSQAGRLDEALALLDRAQKEFDVFGTDVDRIMTAGGRAQILRRMDRPADSLAVADALLTSDVAGRIPFAAVDAQLARSNALFSLDRLGEAADAAREALRGALEIGEPDRQLIALSELGSALAQRGRTAAALACIERYLERGRRAHAMGHVATALETLGKLRTVLRDPDGALTAYREAIEICETTGASRRAAALRQLVGSTLLAKGDLAGAERELRRTLRSAAERGNRSLAVDVCRSLAKLAELQGDVERALFEYERARSLAARIGDHFCLQAALGDSANLEAKLGRAQEALPRFAEAIAIAHEKHFRGEETERLAQRAGAFARLERWRESLDDCRAALDLLDEQRNGLGELEAEGLQSDEAGVASNAAIAADRLLRQGGEGASDLAPIVFALAERSRARTLLEALAAARDALRSRVPADALAAEAAARKRVTASHAAPSDGDYAEWVRAVGRVQRSLAAAGIPSTAAPITLEAFQSQLAADTAFIDYVDAGDDRLALALTRRTRHLAEIPKRAEIDERVSRFVELASSPLSSLRDVVETGTPLRDALLEPFESDLASVSRLVISPCGCLARLPFEALPDPVSDAHGERFVIDRYEVAYAPSASIDVWLRGRGNVTGTGALVLTAPTATGLPELRHAESEADAVSAFFDAREVRRIPNAREAALRAVVPVIAGRRFRAVHFACHGSIEPERPLLSALRLAPEPDGSPDDGRLTAIEVSRLRIPADVAVLSACRTAEGPWRAGEGVAGLVRAFILAGSDRVVVSQWSVDDEATRALAVAFYEGLCRDGLSPAAALRRAKLAIRAANTRADGAVAKRGSLEPATVATRADWSHPYFWSAFVIWGRTD